MFIIFKGRNNFSWSNDRHAARKAGLQYSLRGQNWKLELTQVLKYPFEKSSKCTCAVSVWTVEVFNSVWDINVHRSFKNKKCIVLERSLTSCKAKRKENILIFLTILNKLGRISDVFWVRVLAIAIRSLSLGSLQSFAFWFLGFLI